MKMKKNWVRRVSIVLAAFFLLAVLPMSAMAEKETSGAAVSEATMEKATPSSLTRSAATPSNYVAEDVTEKIAPAEAPKVKMTAEQLIGRWKADETTSYRFSKDGRGALVLPKKSYAFEYSIEDAELVLAFKSEKIGKVTFLYTLEEDSLTLERAEGGFEEVILGREAR